MKSLDWEREGMLKNEEITMKANTCEGRNEKRKRENRHDSERFMGTKIFIGTTLRVIFR
jgi:hypothetical protein